MPDISVIIPIYNKQKYIKDTLESILNQSFKNFEIILINDGSTDLSASIIKSFSDSRLKYFEQENKGVSFTRNRGVSLAQSNLIAFLDADDIWMPHHLQTIINLSKKYPKSDFFGTAYQIQYQEGLIKNYVLNISDKNDFETDKFYKYYKGSLIFYTSNFAIRKNIFEKENGFKTHIHGEDTEFFFRLGFKYKLAYSKTITMKHIKNSENSLFANYKTDKKMLLLDELKEFEKQDKDLKRILDLNRFAWIMEYIISKDKEKAKLLKEQIDKRNLNLKQKIILFLPAKAIKNLKNFQKFLIRKKIYLSPFSKS